MKPLKINLPHVGTVTLSDAVPAPHYLAEWFLMSDDLAVLCRGDIVLEQLPGLMYRVVDALRDSIAVRSGVATYVLYRYGREISGDMGRGTLLAYDDGRRREIQKGDTINFEWPADKVVLWWKRRAEDA
jgi:hypothetical protein